MEKPILLRPHHGMCLAYFVGKGYSEGFSSHMGKMLNLLEHNVPVKLVVQTDAICAACPNHQDQVCTSYGNSKEYDRKVLDFCGITEGTELDFLELVGMVEKKILKPGLRRKICGQCRWNDICSSQKSRWENI